MVTPIFDCDKWTIKSEDLIPSPTTFSAGRGVGGFRQIRSTGNGYWRGTITLNPLFRNDLIEFRGWIAGLHGSSVPFDMCLCQPNVISGDGLTYEEWLAALGYNIGSLCGPIGGLYGEPFSDGTCFSDGSGFLIEPYTPPSVSDAVLPGATSLSLSGGSLEVGTRFSTRDNYMYVVTSRTNDGIGFAPPMRQAIYPGEPLETAKPTVRVRLSSDDSGRVVSEYGRWSGDISLSVEEVIDR